MKKLLITVMMIFSLCIVAHAEHENISTSQYYVDTNLATKQNAVPAQNANSVMTYDSTSADGIGSKAIYNPNSSYAGQSKALVTASTANTAIQNGINNEFVCKNPPECTLWKIRNTMPPVTLHNDYTELQYAEGTGTQWMCTGVAISKTDTAKMEMDAQITSGTWMGADGFLQLYTGNGYYSVHNSSTAPQTAVAIGNRDKIILDYDQEQTLTLYVNNRIVDSVSWASWGNHTNFFNIFGLGRASQCSLYSMLSGLLHAKIYGLKLIKNNSVVRNYIPARRNSDNVVGVYDIVTNTFFKSSGSGEFIGGPVVNTYMPRNQ